MKYLLDTNICIYLMKDSYPKMTSRFLSMDPSDFCISAITVYELEYGAAKSKWGEKNRNNLMLFLAPFRFFLLMEGLPPMPEESEAILRNMER